MRLASRGLRETEKGTEAITDPSRLAAVRAQARRVHWRALALATIGTLVAWLLPMSF